MFSTINQMLFLSKEVSGTIQLYIFYVLKINSTPVGKFSLYVSHPKT